MKTASHSSPEWPHERGFHVHTSRHRRNAGCPQPRTGLLQTYRTEIAIAVGIVVLLVAVGFFVPSPSAWATCATSPGGGAPDHHGARRLPRRRDRGIDLSVGSVFSLTGMVTALTMANGSSSLTASLAGLGVGLAFARSTVSSSPSCGSRLSS